MGGIASAGQLRWSFARWAVVCVPLVLLLGFLSGSAVPAGRVNGWYVSLAKPNATPPDWLFPVAWSGLYVLLGLALAIVLNARGARRRGAAVTLFAVLMAALFVWQPLFFGAHRIGAALALIGFIFVCAIAVALLFGRVRASAGWLIVPLIAWVGFAGALTWRIAQLNPAAERVAPGPHTSQML